MSRARILTGNADDAEDLVQETLVEMIRHLGIESDEELRMVAFRALARNHLDAIRKKSRSLPEADWLEVDDDQHKGDDFSIDIALMEMGIDTLPDSQRDLVLLRALGLTVREIEELTGISRSAILTQLDRARRVLVR